jgi:hypothetical protein
MTSEIVYLAWRRRTRRSVAPTLDRMKDQARS